MSKNGLQNKMRNVFGGRRGKLCPVCPAVRQEEIKGMKICAVWPNFSWVVNGKR